MSSRSSRIRTAVIVIAAMVVLWAVVSVLAAVNRQADEDPPEIDLRSTIGEEVRSA